MKFTSWTLSAIPTNRPVQRIDHTDLIYRTEKGKYKAIIEQIAECHEKGQPVLVWYDFH